MLNVWRISEIIIIISCILIPLQIILLVSRLWGEGRRAAKDDLLIVEGLLNGLKRGNYQSSQSNGYAQDHHHPHEEFIPWDSSYNGGFGPAELAANSASPEAAEIRKLKKRTNILIALLIGFTVFLLLCVLCVLAIAL